MTRTSPFLMGTCGLPPGVLAVVHFIPGPASSVMSAAFAGYPTKVDPKTRDKERTDVKFRIFLSGGGLVSARVAWRLSYFGCVISTDTSKNLLNRSLDGWQALNLIKPELGAGRSFQRCPNAA